MAESPAHTREEQRPAGTHTTAHGRSVSQTADASVVSSPIQESATRCDQKKDDSESTSTISGFRSHVMLRLAILKHILSNLDPTKIQGSDIIDLSGAKMKMIRVATSDSGSIEDVGVSYNGKTGAVGAGC